VERCSKLLGSRAWAQTIPAVWALASAYEKLWYKYIPVVRVCTLAEFTTWITN